VDGLFVQGVNSKVGFDYISRGGFGHVLKGELEGTSVALKLSYKIRYRDTFGQEGVTRGHSCV
jgi:hypothetical protein